MRVAAAAMVVDGGCLKVVVDDHEKHDGFRGFLRRFDRVIEAIVGASKTGKVGDGKIFVTDIIRVLRIRTGETDADAL